MRTVIVTAGTGAEHEAQARRLVSHINRIAEGVPGAIPAADISSLIPWSSLSYPPLCKLHVWRVVSQAIERVVWIDTDCYVTRAIVEDDLPTVPFAAVKDPWIQGGDEAAKCKAFTGERAVFYQMPCYFNSGFYSATRAAIPAFDLAIEQEPRKFRKRPTWVREQDLFNWAVWSVLGNMSPDNAGWVDVGERWNCLLCKRLDPTIVPVVCHLAGWSAPNKNRILKALFAGKDLACIVSS